MHRVANMLVAGFAAPTRRFESDDQDMVCTNSRLAGLELRGLNAPTRLPEDSRCGIVTFCEAAARRTYSCAISHFRASRFTSRF